MNPFAQCLAPHGYAQWNSFQPASRFWPFQWIEGGWLLVLAALLIAVTIWLVAPPRRLTRSGTAGRKGSLASSRDSSASASPVGWSDGIGDRSEDQRFPQRGHPDRQAGLQRRGRQASRGSYLVHRRGRRPCLQHGKGQVKGRALARDPRAALCVDLEEPPYGFVQVQGEAEISEDPGELVRTATAIAARYMGQDRAEEFGKRNGVPGELVVRLRPTKVIAAFEMTA